MKKTVAILTQYYKNANYGGILQAYALQKFLQNSGYDAKQISYRLQSGYPGYRKIQISSTLKLIVKKLIKQDWYIKNSAFENKIYEFADTIPHTKPLNVKELNTLIDQFDIFIVGSDQVWNPIGWQPAMFFDFLPQGKFCMSYAASIARYSLTKSEQQFIKLYINKLQYISVREKESVRLLEGLTKKKIEVMPDPTFLLESEEWHNIATERLIEEQYIFAYFLGNNIEQREKTICYAKNNGLRIVFIPYMNKDWLEWDKKNIKYMMSKVGIPEFLSLIKYAEMVVTDSFHGTVFSLIFGKSFFVFNRFKNNDIESMNSRIDTLLDNFQLSNCVGDEVNNSVHIDNTNIKKHLEQLKLIGKTYLLNCLKKG